MVSLAPFKEATLRIQPKLTLLQSCLRAVEGVAVTGIYPEASTHRSGPKAYIVRVEGPSQRLEALFGLLHAINLDLPARRPVA